MGLRIRKSIKIAPSVKVNIGKKSVGVSVGGKHGGVSVNSKSGINTRVSVPGTGISYSQHVAKASKVSRKTDSKQISASSRSSTALFFLGITLIIVGIIAIGAGIYIREVLPADSSFLYGIGGFCVFLGIIYTAQSRKKK